jgi:hypothetical protein
VQQRLAARDHDHGRSALVDRLHALGNRKALVEDRIRIIDLAAAGAGQVAAEQRLEHQDERVALDPAKVAADDIGADASHLVQRNRHGKPRVC